MCPIIGVRQNGRSLSWSQKVQGCSLLSARLPLLSAYRQIYAYRALLSGLVVFRFPIFPSAHRWCTPLHASCLFPTGRDGRSLWTTGRVLVFSFPFFFFLAFPGHLVLVLVLCPSHTHTWSAPFGLGGPALWLCPFLPYSSQSTIYPLGKDFSGQTAGPRERDQTNMAPNRTANRARRLDSSRLARPFTPPLRPPRRRPPPKPPPTTFPRPWPIFFSQLPRPCARRDFFSPMPLGAPHVLLPPGAHNANPQPRAAHQNVRNQNCHQSVLSRAQRFLARHSDVRGKHV